MPTPTRRDALRYAALATSAALPGCFGDGRPGVGPVTTTATAPDLAVAPAEVPGQVRPSGEPRTVPEPLVCDDDSFTRFALPAWAEGFTWGTTSADGTPKFALRTSSLTVEPGDEVTVTLTNLRATNSATGHRDLYTVEVYTESGWQDVRGWRQGTPRPWPALEVSHEPQSGFEWRLTLAEGGLSPDHIHGEALTVCPGLPAGRYRFVYRGADTAVGVAFDVVE